LDKAEAVRFSHDLLRFKFCESQGFTLIDFELCILDSHRIHPDRDTDFFVLVLREFKQTNRSLQFHRRPFVGVFHARSWSRLLVLGAISWAFIAKSYQNILKT